MGKALIFTCFIVRSKLNVEPKTIKHTLGTYKPYRFLQIGWKTVFVNTIVTLKNIPLQLQIHCLEFFHESGSELCSMPFAFHVLKTDPVMR